MATLVAWALAPVLKRPSEPSHALFKGTTLDIEIAPRQEQR
jgi:hypothetical protein